MSASTCIAEDDAIASVKGLRKPGCQRNNALSQYTKKKENEKERMKVTLQNKMQHSILKAKLKIKGLKYMILSTTTVSEKQAHTCICSLSHVESI